MSWYRCHGKNAKGQIKVYGWGNSENIAEYNAIQAALQYIQKYEPYTSRLHSWSFIIEDRSKHREVLQACNKTGFRKISR